MYFPSVTCDLHSVSLHHQCRMIGYMQLCVPFLSLFPSVSLRVNSCVLEGLLTTWMPSSTQLTSVKSCISYILAFLFCQDGSWMCCSETHFGELIAGVRLSNRNRRSINSCLTVSNTCLYVCCEASYSIRLNSLVTEKCYNLFINLLLNN